ncbi:PREDICTED: sphingoid long-chain bases kinase 1-like isoform X3 [Populus euphratica]|uniref:Sphingoid long-chain bases kinase 1-like isoform X3 n=1 Tax=Populus euphratica TaxID=75702 RepID=A0AAJ6XW19_POPEU|nr:PREDICTED: sphingoid long-chain bases kinase 1-like isoform X3 [Populus euphratica]
MHPSKCGNAVSRNDLGSNSNATTATTNNSNKSQRRLSLCSQIAMHSSPIVFPEKQKRSKKPKAAASNSKRSMEVVADDPFPFNQPKIDELKIDIGGGAAAGGDENSDLLGYVVFSGKLILDRRSASSSSPYHSNTIKDQADITNQQAVDAKLTSKALVWGSRMLHLEHVISLAGFKLEVVKTTSAGHAKNLASTVDISTCPDGIICVGGDGIINEVLNGLLSRDNQKEGISIPIGIIPAGSDNSLVWTVLGVRDPVSAAISIVKGGLTATDVFAVEWIQSGVIHFGMTVSYYGFVSDVLELSEKYQKRFGPLRYFVAGFLKFFCLPKYSYEVEYLPASKEDREGKQSAEGDIVDMPDLYTDVIRRSNTDGIPRASSLSSIDSIMTPSRMSGGDMDTTCSSTHASTEPSDYVRGLDPKAKRLSSGRTNVMPEPEVIHPQLPLSTTPNWPRTRSKSRADKGWTGLTTTHDPSRCSWGNASMNDREDISSTISDPGPIWDAEPKWDTEPNWDVENPIDLPGPSDDIEGGMKKEVIPRLEDKWEFKKGQFLGILVCNHACRTVQSSQVVAPRAEHDDNTMDMLLVHGSGRWRLLRFFLRLQMGQHLSLPYVECIKVKSVKIKAGKHTPTGCGIDGELIQLNGQVISSLLPEQCRLIGRFPSHPI